MAGRKSTSNVIVYTNLLQCSRKILFTLTFEEANNVYVSFQTMNYWKGLWAPALKTTIKHNSMWFGIFELLSFHHINIFVHLFINARNGVDILESNQFINASRQFQLCIFCIDFQFQIKSKTESDKKWKWKMIEKVWEREEKQIAWWDLQHWTKWMRAIENDEMVLSFECKMHSAKVFEFVYSNLQSKQTATQSHIHNLFCFFQTHTSFSISLRHSIRNNCM